LLVLASITAVMIEKDERSFLCFPHSSTREETLATSTMTQSIIALNAMALECLGLRSNIHSTVSLHREGHLVH